MITKIIPETKGNGLLTRIKRWYYQTPHYQKKLYNEFDRRVKQIVEEESQLKEWQIIKPREARKNQEETKEYECWPKWWEVVIIAITLLILFILAGGLIE